MKLFLFTILILFNIQCSGESKTQTPKDDDKKGDREELASEPVMVGGAFLIECGLASDDSNLIGCKTKDESTNLADIETRAYFIESEDIYMVDGIELQNSQWEIWFDIPALNRDVASFHLELIGEDGDASYVHTEKLSQLNN